MIRRLVAAALLLWAGLAAGQAQPPALEVVTTLETGDDLAVLAAWSPDGRRLAYATEKEVRERKPPSLDDRETYRYPGEVWLTDFAGKPRRIFKHERFRDWTGNVPSYYVTGLAWSPDGAKMAVEVTEEAGESAVFLITAGGKAVRIGSNRENFYPGYGAAWLSDSESLGYLGEASQPRLLHRVYLLRVTAGRALELFRGKTFAAVAWLPAARQAILVEQDSDYADPPQLMLGDLEKGTLERLDPLAEGYLGWLAATPDETKVSYFIGQNKLTVRSLAAEGKVEHWPIPLGRYRWLTSGALLYLEPEERGQRTGWLTLYDRASDTKTRLLPEVTLYDFWVSPDGTRVAVLTAGPAPELRIYKLAAR
jgi:hypothetical protein